MTKWKEDGFYWSRNRDGTWDILQVIGNEVVFFGNEMTSRLDDFTPEDFGPKIEEPS